MHKLSVEAPPKILVERYLIEIAKNYNVPYEPDAMVRVGINFLFLSNFLISTSSICFKLSSSVSFTARGVSG